VYALSWRNDRAGDGQDGSVGISAHPSQLQNHPEEWQPNNKSILTPCFPYRRPCFTYVIDRQYLINKLQ